MSGRAQRLRVTYARGEELKYVAHLDMMRFWERALRRAQIRVAYSEGFSPHAQISLGAPLSVGMTGRAELMDVFLAEPLPPEEFRERLQSQLPTGVLVVVVDEVAVSEPSVQSQLRATDYELRLVPDANLDAVARVVNAFLAADTFPWEHVRETQTKRYDLRPLVLELRLERRSVGGVLFTRLRAEEAGTGRPDQLAAALGLSDRINHVERIGLVLANAALANG